MEEKAQTKEKQKQPTEIVISRPEAAEISTISKPLVNAAEAIKAWDEYQALADAICKEEDVQLIKGKEFKKKSFWRKIDKFFGLSLELISEKEDVKNALVRKYKQEKENRKGEKYYQDVTEVEYYPLNIMPEIRDSETEIAKRTFVFTVIYRATAPNGQYMEGDGACDTWEDGYPDSYHNARAVAHTRAKNRAIADLVGFGETSAEEIRSGDKRNSSNEEPSENDKEKMDIIKNQILLELKADVFTDEERKSKENNMGAVRSLAGLKGMLKGVQRELGDRRAALKSEQEVSKEDYTVESGGVQLSG